MELTGENVALVIRETGGDLRQSTLRQWFGGGGADWVARKLEQLGLVERVGNRGARRLAVPVHVAVPTILKIGAWRDERALARRKDFGKARLNIARPEMVLLHDPGGLFAPGARFPVDQVLPGEGEEPDAWYIGTRFEYRYNGERRTYVYDGEAVVEEW